VNIKKVIIIFLALVLVIFAANLVSQKIENNKTSIVLPDETPTVEQQMKEKFKGLVIPDDTEKIELTNVSGEEGMGIATKNEIIADLPNLPKGESYQVVLIKGTETIILGNLTQTKGGWILEYDLSNYPGYNQIIVVKGTKHILEGSF